MSFIVVSFDVEGTEVDDEVATARKDDLNTNETLEPDKEGCSKCDAEKNEATDSFCDDCDLYRDHRDRMILRSVTIVFLLLEIVLGTACFAVEVGWEIGSSYVQYYDRHLNETNVHRMVTRTRLLYTAVTVFPFLLLPLILLPLIITKKFCTFSFMALFAAFIGFGTFMACGVIAAVSLDLPNIHIQAFQGFAGLAIGTGLIFGIHVGCEIWKYIYNPVFQKG